MRARPARLLTALVLAAAALMPPVRTAAQADDGGLLDPSQLHDIQLVINTRDVERLREGYLDNRFYAADVQWRDTRVRNAAVRSRGGGSRNPVKLGLLLEFDRYVTGQRFAGRRALVLDNLWQDPSMIRERVAMALYERLGQLAPRESFARLFINGDYQGVYAIVENVDEDFITRATGSPPAQLYEYHWLRPYYFEDLGGDLSTYADVFEARSNTRASDRELYEPLRNMLRAINGAADGVWRDEVSAHVDLEQVVTSVAIGTFMSEWDDVLGYAGVNNIYLYRAAGSTQHQFVPWDRDNAFHDDDPGIFRRVHENELLRRALTYPDLYVLYLDTLERAAQSASENGWLEREMRAAAGLIETAAAEDPRAPYPSGKREEDLQFLFEFAKRRPQDVLNQVASARAAQ